MTKLRVLIVGILVLAGLSQYTGVEAATPDGTVRVGTFDSRAVAIAYGRSEEFRNQIKAMREEHEAAKAAGNEERVAELETEGPALQDLFHKQAFGTWPVDEILDRIREQIPGIAHQAGVDVIVSKWDLVHQAPGVELIDVTDRMVQPFNPDDETLGIIEELKNHPPVPIEDLHEH